MTRLELSCTVAGALAVGACGDVVAEIAIDESPREARFTLDAPGRVAFATSFEIENSSFRYREDVPHVVDYEIEILEDEARVARLVCNPFDMTVRSSGKNGDLRLSSLSGSLDGCDARLPAAGTYVVRARLVWLDPDQRLDLDEVMLSVAR